MCECVCVWRHIKAQEQGRQAQRGCGSYATLVIYKPSPSLLFYPSFFFPVRVSLPPSLSPSLLLLITRRASLMSKHYQCQPLCPLSMTMPLFFLLIGHLDNCDRWLLLQRGYGKQLALTHRATAALQIVARNYMPGY